MNQLNKIKRIEIKNYTHHRNKINFSKQKKIFYKLNKIKIKDYKF
jgi:hypothetical protein